MYDEAKRFAEAMTMAYHRYHGVDARIVRIFNTYGPGMRPDDGRMIPSFFVQALRGEDLTVFGDGRQTRSVCYVSDLVEGIVRLLGSSYFGPVNLGNPEELTVVDVAKLILAITGAQGPARRTASCRPTIRRCAAPTSRSRAACSAGSRRSAPKRACARRFRTSSRQLERGST